jgi:tRNA threonylcarbamoyl adenosine modification protein YjeE
VAEGVASEFGTLGIRIPDYDLMLKIVASYGKPITATSANASGKKRPYSVADILSGLSEKQKSLIDLILDAGELPHNEPSTVIDTTLSTPVTMRESNRAEHNFGTQNNGKATILISKSEQETKEIAGKILLKHWDDIVDKGLVLALNGDLGVGKTIFTKGSADFLNIEDTITSPTYTYIEEYNYSRYSTEGKLFHLDMWKVSDQELFKRLEIEKLIQEKNVIVIEWFSQIENYIKSMLKDVPVVIINFLEIDGKDRQLEIKESK